MSTQVSKPMLWVLVLAIAACEPSVAGPDEAVEGADLLSLRSMTDAFADPGENVLVAKVSYWLGLR